MKVYSYNWATGEYIGDTEADPDPLEPGNFLMPAYTTAKVPPEIDEPGMQVCFDKEDDEWKIEPIPPAPRPPLKEQLEKIPTNSLLGDQTIGDLFNAV